MADESKHKPKFEFSYREKIKNSYTPEDLEAWNYASRLGEPGEYPFTRGVQGRGRHGTAF
jgi:methylmalonyl-CoA mutase, N-terminal domain